MLTAETRYDYKELALTLLLNRGWEQRMFATLTLLPLSHRLRLGQRGGRRNQRIQEGLYLGTLSATATEPLGLR